MSEKLILSLIDKGAIKPKTHISAIMSKKDFSGKFVSITKDFSLRCIIKNNEKIMFAATLLDSPNKELYRIPLTSVKKLDGMDLKAMAKVYDLKADGSPRLAKIDPITGKPLRRGRKPNWVKEKMAELEKSN